MSVGRPFDREAALKVLADNAERTERQERIAAASLDAVRQLGGFAIATPVGHGGNWAGTEAMARLLAGLGRSCPSTAWVTGTCTTAKLLAASVYSDRARREIFADPDALVCGSGRPSGRGVATADGVLVRGRWPNVSGCEDAAWAGLGVMVDGTFSMALIPTADLSVSRTWRMAGMRGTGSHSLVAEELLVPAHRVAPMSPPGPADAVRFAITVLGPVVGAAQGALDVQRSMFASDRKPFMTSYSRMSESPAARQWLAESTTMVDRAARTMMDVAATVDDQPVDAIDHARLRLQLADAAEDCRGALSRMLDLHGASGFDTSNPLQRYWRDVEVGSRHPYLSRYLAVEEYGRRLADLHTSA